MFTRPFQMFPFCTSKHILYHLKVLPKAATLKGSENGVRIENSSKSYPIQMKVGDTLNLNCTVHMGNNPNATIEWKRSDPYSNGLLLPFPPNKNHFQGRTIKGDNCQYIRSETMNATETQVGNISYSCSVIVNTPRGDEKHVDSEVVFVEICTYNM